MLDNLKAELLPPVLCKGLPNDEDFRQLDVLAEAMPKRTRGL